MAIREKKQSQGQKNSLQSPEKKDFGVDYKTVPAALTQAKNSADSIILELKKKFRTSQTLPRRTVDQTAIC